MAQKVAKRAKLAGEVVFTRLPGPSRKRTDAPYCYRLIYRDTNPQAGCPFIWDVLGGREIYQIALERREDGGLRYHCTCADAVFRGERSPHVCKHVRGLMATGRPRNEEPS